MIKHNKKNQRRQNLNTKGVFDMLQELPRDNTSQAMEITCSEHVAETDITTCTKLTWKRNSLLLCI
jgi:hypothetical protein